MPKRKTPLKETVKAQNNLDSLLIDDNTKEMVTSTTPKATVQAKSSKTKASPAPVATKAQKKMGRPAVGKRSNPDYRQVTIFIPKDLHKTAKRTAEDIEQDFSDYTADALKAWQKKQGR